MSFAAITPYVASQRVFNVVVVVFLIRYQLSPETFGYTLVCEAAGDILNY
jgi:hypothetical protein